ncbi:MAG: efflux RND transporter periplasmic adaptor subunit [Dyella sp.]
MSWKKITLIALAVLGVALAARYLHRPAADAGTSAKPVVAAVPVQAVHASRGDIELSLRVVGRVEAWSTVTLRARVSSQIQRLAFEPGARVSKGQLLVQLDTSVLNAQLDQARANLARDQAQLVKAQADEGRFTQMLDKGYVSKADYDIYKANLGIARAAVQSDRAGLELAQAQLDFASVRAPFDAVAGLPLAWPGALVTADTTDLVVLNQIEPVRVSFNIPEDSLPAVRAAQVDGVLPVKAVISGTSGTSGAPRMTGASEPLAGTLNFIDNAVDATTGTITLKARFANQHNRLTPGQFVEVSLPTTRLSNAVSIPAQALQSSSKGNFVFVIGAGDKVEQRYVSTGAHAGTRIVIDKGLAGSELVVTEGQMLLVDGARVKISADG